MPRRPTNSAMAFGDSLDATEADEYMSYFTVIAVLSVIGNIISIWILYFMKHNADYFMSKIVIRICWASGVLSLCQLFNPDTTGGDRVGLFSTAIDMLFPVVTLGCYVQSMLSVALGNLIIFWQCCLIHSVFEINVRKNQRPEDLLTGYDNRAVLFSVVVSLCPWLVNGYGWQWFRRCYYNTHRNGNWADLLTAIVHFLCLLYIVVLSVQMYRRLVHEKDMTIDYRRLPALKRRWAFDVKYIFASWFFVLCKAPKMISSAADLIQLVSTGNFVNVPDDLPFILVGITAMANGIYGVVLCCVLVAFDWRKIQCLNRRCDAAYSTCTGEFIAYSRQDSAVGHKIVMEAENRDCKMHHLMSQRLRHIHTQDSGVSDLLYSPLVYLEEYAPAAWETGAETKPKDYKLSFTTLLMSAVEARIFKQHKDAVHANEQNVELATKPDSMPDSDSE